LRKIFEEKGKLKTSGSQAPKNCYTRNIVIGDEMLIKEIMCALKNLIGKEDPISYPHMKQVYYDSGYKDDFDEVYAMFKNSRTSFKDYPQSPIEKIQTNPSH
jgi:hypothetical protein